MDSYCISIPVVRAKSRGNLTMKKTLAFVCACLFGLAIVGCTEKPAATETPAAPAAEEAAPAAEEAAPAAEEAAPAAEEAAPAAEAEVPAVPAE